jgi:hypothetical protein
MSFLNCDFSYKHYFETLNIAKKTYEILPIGKYENCKKIDNFILLRHDIDFSLDAALELAKLESKNKIFSTYYILLHSNFYNALSETGKKFIKKISSLGHEIGLHYDTNFLSSNQEEAKNQLEYELSILSSITNKKILTAVAHNPSLNSNSKFQLPENIIDPMSKKLLNDTLYISDSTQNWRNKCMCAHINNKSKLQILTHPIWWSKESSNRIQNMNFVLNSNFIQNKSEINKMIKIQNNSLSSRKV